MSESLPQFLKRRANRSFHNLLEQIQGLTAEQALFGRQANWPDHRWGIGQDGSIAGIVYHVAAWKQMTLPLFAPDGQPLDRSTFDPFAAPPPDDWPALTAWLSRIGNEWNEQLADLPDSAFDENRFWESATIKVATYVSEMMEHDIYHAAQIAYLRQRLAIEQEKWEDLAV